MEEKKEKKKYSPEQALKKAEAYCAYQERYQQEVRDKLYSWGLWQEAVENIISHLITENFLNEERFAKAYAGGKYRIKKWGKTKIVLELKKRNISEYCINQAVKELKDDYSKTLKKVLADKAKDLKEKNPLKRKYRLAQYAISRGFEPELVWEQVKIID